MHLVHTLNFILNAKSISICTILFNLELLSRIQRPFKTNRLTIQKKRTSQLVFNRATVYIFSPRQMIEYFKMIFSWNALFRGNFWRVHYTVNLQFVSNSEFIFWKYCVILCFCLNTEMISTLLLHLVRVKILTRFWWLFLFILQGLNDRYLLVSTHS